MGVNTVGDLLRLHLDNAFKIVKGKQVVELDSPEEYQSYDRLVALCRNSFGADDVGGLQQAIAKVALFANRTQAEVQRIPLSKFVDRLTGALAAEGKGGAVPNELATPEARAIMRVQQAIKDTGKLPTKTALAHELGIDRRTLNNWRAFKVAYAQFKAQARRQPARGTKSKDGTMEAWRESGK